MRLEVLTSVWGCGDVEYVGGVHDDVQVTRKTAPLFAGAEAAGAIRVVSASKDERALLSGHVQSQADGEKAQAQAMGDPHPDLLDDGRKNPLAGVMTGPWQHGNHVDFIAQRKAQLASDSLDKHEREAVERELADAEARLKEIPEP